MKKVININFQGNVVPIEETSYELLKQYELIGERTLVYEDLKKMLELDHYSMFGTFYQRVISPAIEEINKNTDLFIYDVHKLKDGKKVVALHFYFRRKNEEELAKEPLAGAVLSARVATPGLREYKYGTSDRR